MNSLVKSLIQPLLEESSHTVALYPGKFKPPHRGHFEVAKRLLNKADEVVIVISPLTVEGITAEQSKKVWDLYNSSLDNKLTVKIVDKSPVKYVLDTIKDNPNNKYIAAFGKGESERFKSLSNKPNTTIEDEGTFDKLNARDLRSALANSKDISKFLPKGITPDQYEKALGMDEMVNESTVQSPSDFKEALKSLTKYMIDQGMNIKPLPRVISISNDSKNAENILGKTAYYNPNNCSITLFTLNRHPKDILRSYAHEMIHRMQDNEGRLNNINTTNTNEDDSLEELEKEAYLKGNITFRNWEDSIKNPKPLNEGRYDTISNKTSSMIFNKWKQDFEKGEKQGNLTTIIKNDDIEFNLKATIEFRNSGKTIVDGSLLEKNDEFTIFANFKVNKNKLPQEWSEISMGLKDVIRHEIEHITQANPETSKFMDDEVDQLTRDSINSKLLPLAYYFKLEKEVDANLQGMYFRAKKEKRPFIDVINDYLDGQNITPKQKEEILTLWRTRAKALSLPEF